MEENNMKKINLSSKAKKSIIITGSALVCVAVAAIALNMGGGVTAATEPQSTASSSSSTSAVISVSPIVPQASEAEGQVESTFTPSSGSSKATELTKIEKPTSAPPAPVVEGDASTASDGKVTPPTNPALTDKSKKPSYTKKPTAKSKSTTSTPSNSKASGGKPGQVYDPVFGWQYPTGGKGTTVEGDWGGGSQVGIMD
jgi:hypothetical protein